MRKGPFSDQGNLDENAEQNEERDEEGPEKKKLKREPTQLMELDEESAPPTPTTLPRQLSMLVPQAHAGTPLVLLRPRLVMKEGVISRVVISRLQRTPSPFGSRMGDHTVAWQAVVDAMHALLCGKPLSQALTIVRDQQNAVSGWMNDTTSDGRKLLLLLDDAVERRPLLENAAFQANAFLASAAAPTNLAGLQADLERAIAWHLTYVNYLPYATVPAKSARGSHGSGEGTHRKVLLAEEVLGQPDVNASIASDPFALDDALWGMFAFDAALREARADLAVVPASVTTSLNTHKKLTPLAAQCLMHINTVLSRGPKRKTKVAYDWLDTKPPISPPKRTLAEIIDKASPYATSEEEYPALSRLARFIRDAADYLNKLTGMKQDINVLKTVAEYQTELGLAIIDAEKLNAFLEKRKATALPDAALILAHLLHDHQATVARAYPRSIIRGRFLKPSAADAATTMLRDVIEETFAKPDSGQVTALIKEVTRLLVRAGQPVLATANDWAAGAANDELVVRYDRGQPLTVTGRAPAPAGVSGMGCHTTAWIIETMAADAIVNRAVARSKDPLAALRRDVHRDLDEGPILLDCLLPPGQLLGGQLRNIFDYALQALTATTIEDAVIAYLTFRNLLPYATVDGGDRRGQGESPTASRSKTLDSEALSQAAETQAELLIDKDRRAEATTVLEEAARRLDEEPNPNWARKPSINTAVAASIERLRDQATAQDGEVQVKVDIIEKITEARTAEHRRTYKLSRDSALAG